MHGAVEQPGSIVERHSRSFPSLREQVLAYLEAKSGKRQERQENHQLVENYGPSLVRSKIAVCAQHPKACSDAYLNRREEASRGLSKEKRKALEERIKRLAQGRLHAAQEKLVRRLKKRLVQREILTELEEKPSADDLSEATLRQELAQAEEALHQLEGSRVEETPSDAILLEEASQELALTQLEEKIKQGAVDPAALNAQMWLELELPKEEEIAEFESIDDVLRHMQDEVKGYVEKGFLTSSEAETITVYARRYAEAFTKGFCKRLGKQTWKELGELTRDNARKVVYQTKMDKRTLAGSDHGVRHIYEGNTHFAEQIMDSLREAKGVDFKSRDEVLIRQIIIDHDMGYTTEAAMAKNGSGAAKDHPCIGCRYVELNKEYYAKKFGEEGYHVIRDVLLNHSYPSAKYHKERPKGAFTYNFNLIRSVVSSSDSLSTTHETKAMSLFRFPEAIEILQNISLYADSHGGTVDSAALDGFRQDFHRLITQLTKDGKISSQRGKEYAQAVDHKLNVDITKKTFGQFSGAVRRVGLEKKEKGSPEFRIVVHLETSRLQSLVADAFGDPVSINGFKKAMEAFGMDAEELKRLGKIVGELRRTKDPNKERRALKGQLVFMTDRAKFIIGEEETSGLSGERGEEREAIIQQFETFHQETARNKIQTIFDRMYQMPRPRSKHAFLGLENELNELFELEDPMQTARLKNICVSIQRHLADKKDDALEALQVETQKLLSKNERARLAGKIS